MEWEISNDFTESVIGHDGYLKMNMITTLMLHAHASQALLLMLLLKLMIACLSSPPPGGLQQRCLQVHRPWSIAMYLKVKYKDKRPKCKV